MKQTRAYPAVTVDRRARDRILAGHPWIYDTQLRSVDGVCENGCLTDVLSESGAYLGTGIFSRQSKIRVRLLSRNANDAFDGAFFARRIRWAWQYRKTVLRQQDLDCCRIIFGEADQFPGLTVDRFGDVLVTQTLSVGMEARKEQIFTQLCQVLEEDGRKVSGIYERNDVAIRRLEGMEENKGWYALPGRKPPESTATLITENGISYLVDFENGQKTGFFLDQKFNRQAAACLAKGKKVLDCFCHTGSFALNAAAAGAAHVHAVDVSESAVMLAGANARRNALEANMSFQAANVFDLLPALDPAGYDYIILDPPAFTKSRKTLEAAMRGYKEINLRAMKLLPRGGYLATCSCSHFMTDALFTEMLAAAARDAHVQIRQIEARKQSPDHPVLWNVPETDYLKFYLLQVL